MGARKLISSGKIANKLKGYENSFEKVKSNEVKRDMLDYYKQSQLSHPIIDKRSQKITRNKNKFSLEDEEYLPNECSLGDFDELPVDKPLKSKISNVISQTKLKKMEMKVVKHEKLSKLAEIDKMFDDVRQNLSLKKNNTEDETDEFDAIKSKLASGNELKATTIQHKNDNLYKKLITLTNNLNVAQIISIVKSNINNIGNDELPELLDFCIEILSKNLKNRNDWWDFTHSICELIDVRKFKSKIYQFFLKCTKIMYKKLVMETNYYIENDNLQNYQAEVYDWKFDSGISKTHNHLLNGNSEIELAAIIFTIKLFPLYSESDTRLGYIAILLMESLINASINHNTAKQLYYEYFTVIYTVSLQNTMFTPVLFTLAQEIIMNNLSIPMELIEEVVINTAIIIKHFANSSSGCYIFSYLWCTHELECQIKRFSNGHLLLEVIDELRQRGLEPLSLLNSQPKSAILEAPKLVLKGEKKKSKDGLKKAVRREKNKVAKVIAKESQVLRDQQISNKLQHKQRIEKRYKEILSAAMIEQEEFRKAATTGGDMDTSLKKHVKKRKNRLAGNDIKLLHLQNLYNFKITTRTHFNYASLVLPCILNRKFSLAKSHEFHKLADDTLDEIYDSLDSLYGEHIEFIDLNNGILTAVFKTMPRNPILISKNEDKSEIWYASHAGVDYFSLVPSETPIDSWKSNKNDTLLFNKITSDIKSILNIKLGIKHKH